MLHRLEQYGRHEFDSIHSGLDSGVYDCVIPFLDLIDADEVEQAEFLTELSAVVAADPDGFATYGAASLTWDLFGDEALRLPAALPLIDTGIRFKLARGVPPYLILTGYELQRFGQWSDPR